MTSCKCDKCGKKWNFLNFWFNFPSMHKQINNVSASRSDMVRKLAYQQKKGKVAKWGDRVPGVNAVVSILPNWPRWARILVTLVVVTSIVLLVVFLN